jgi:hypothetical protein
METMSKEDYELSYKNALETYDNLVSKLANYNNSLVTESATQPMHPNLYYQLIGVSGFMNLNGKTYNEYLEKWEKRRS